MIRHAEYVAAFAEKSAADTLIRAADTRDCHEADMLSLLLLFCPMPHADAAMPPIRHFDAVAADAAYAATTLIIAAISIRARYAMLML